MTSPSARGWFAVDLPARWRATSGASWRSPEGGEIEATEIVHSAREEVTPEAALALHEEWCRDARLHAHEMRLETLPSGATMARSYGETATEEFLLVAHVWWGRFLARLVFRAPLARLRDEDLDAALSLFFHFSPLRRD